MPNHLSHVDLDGVTRKKHKNFLEQEEDFRNDLGPNLFLFLLLNLYCNSFQGHSPQCYST